jgi:hypothetical protein
MAGEMPIYKGFEFVIYRKHALLGSLAVLALTSFTPAHAREARATTVTAAPQTAQAPWYERFTFGSELRDGANAWVPRSESRTEAKIDSRSRWGVTFGVNEEPRPALAPRPGQNNARASAGAFFQVSPKLRVGGAVTLPDERLNATRRRDDTKQREPGVKIESAVRF